MMKSGVVAAMVLALVGCATPTTGVVPRGEGLATVTHQGGGFWVTTDSLKAAAIQEADAHCQRSGKHVKVVHTAIAQGRDACGASLAATGCA